MKLLLCSGDTSLNKNFIEQYLVSWFSVVGQVIGLKTPLGMLDNIVSNNSQIKWSYGIEMKEGMCLQLSMVESCSRKSHICRRCIVILLFDTLNTSMSLTI